jgi:hypothetical protein
MIAAVGPVGTVKKAERSLRGFFQAAVEIRGVGGFPSAASVSTGLRFFLLAHFFWLCAGPPLGTVEFRARIA